MLILCLLAATAWAGQILEPPSDVTVIEGAPASLTCRVDIGEVSWYKDGLEIHRDTERVLLPDGSLFFLTTKNSDTGLYHCQTQDGLTSYPAALIVGTEDEGIVPTVTGEDEEEEEEEKKKTMGLPDIDIEIEDTPFTDLSLSSMEVLEDEEVSSSVYIISMIVVALLTIVIILGAALIFSKIKRVNSNLNTSDCQDRESTAPMMYAVPREIIKQPPPHYNYILTNEYDTPINFVSSDVYKCVQGTYERGSPSSSNHYASSNIVMNGTKNSRTSGGSVRKYQTGADTRYHQPKNNYNYFSC